MHDDPTIRVNPEPTPETQQVAALINIGLHSGVEVSKPASDDPQELQRHLPQYRVRELIGRGGMGNVMKVDDPKLARTVALKVMKLGPGANEEERGRFVREATVLAKLAHPNIVPIYDLGADDEGSPFYTMKLVKGRTLQAIIKDIRDGVADAAKQHSLGRLLGVFRKVCDAMAFAHSSGVIHRDLKPENIMVGEFGEVLVMDWGLAKFLNGEEDAWNGGKLDKSFVEKSRASIGTSTLDATLEGSVMGTPQYMSPEQAEGKNAELDALSDIFSLGAIFYAILTLHPPVEGKSVEEVLRKISSGEITPPSAFGAKTKGGGSQRKDGEVPDARVFRPLPHCPGGHVPSALSAVTMRALSVDKARRYQSVNEFAAEVEAWQSGFATRAENAGTWRQFTLLIKRHKGVSLSLLVLLLATIGFVIKVTASERAAQRSLAELRATAPTFFNQAKLLTDHEKFDEALEKSRIALNFNPNDAAFHAQRGNVLQSMERFAEAADEYAAAVKLNSQEPHAVENVALSRTLAAALEKGSALTVKLRTEWCDALVQQGRGAEAIFAGRSLASNDTKMLPAWQAKMDAWLGKNAPRITIDRNGGYNLDLTKRSLTDLSPLRGMPLNSLAISGNPHLKDLGALADCTLRLLDAIGNSDLVDLAPLKGKKLGFINLNETGVRDLSPLAGMPLEAVYLNKTAVSDLTPLRGTKLKHLEIDHTAVRDLEPLRGHPLEDLHINGTPIASLDPVGDAPLTGLYASSHLDLASVRQRRLHFLYAQGALDHFEVLAEMTDLEALILPSNFSDPAPLRKLPHLRKIEFGENYNGQSVEQFMGTADFFRQYDSPEVQKVRAALATAGLKSLPLKYVNVNPPGRLNVYLNRTSIADLSLLRGMRINALGIEGAPVCDLEPLRGMPLDTLYLSGSSVSSLEPLRGAPLKRVYLAATKVNDVAILADFPDLEEVRLPDPVSNVERLRTLKKLRYLSYKWGGNHPAQTAEEFWKEYDAHQAAGKK